eukprot:maker-scaffold_20-snap-gene-5.11-mRNA-1 protein AED:0.41 eAED:0.41 QI:97/1/1/1/0/0/3/16/108
MLSQLALVVSAFLIVHSGLSTIHYRHLVADLGLEVEVSGWSLPTDVLIEVALGILFGIFGSIVSTQPFVRVDGSETQKKSGYTKNLFCGEDFVLFNHRARYYFKRLNN